MKVSLVIPAYNEEEYLEDCLRSVFSQTLRPNEVIVVDNNSTDKTPLIAKKFNVILVKERKQGTISARNKGFNIATGDIIARIDADTRLPKKWVEKITFVFQKNSQLIAYSGPTLFEDRKFNQLLAFPEKVFIASFRKIIGNDLLYGPNMAIRKNAWQKVKKYTCSNDKTVHEDLDLAIHLGQSHLGEIVFNTRFYVRASERRWKKIAPYFEYPYRYMRTLQHHKQSLHGLKIHTEIVGKVLPKPRKIMKKIRSSAANSLRIAKTITSHYR